MLVRGLLIFALGVAAGAQVATHPPTFVESLDLHSPHGPRISPDGHWVVYSVRSADWKANAYVSQLWLANAATGEHWQLTQGARSASEPEWSPDGREIAFVAERPADADTAPEPPAPDAKMPPKPAVRQIWIIAVRGGEAWQLTRHETNVESFHWSPDGDWIGFTAAAPESAAAKARQKKYSDYVVFRRDYRQTQLWAIHPHPRARAVALIADSKLNVEGFAWSPGGRRIAFTATSDPALAHSGSAQIYLAAAESHATPHRLTALAGPNTNPHFSPDGKALAFNSSMGAADFFYANQRIATLPLEGTSAAPGAQPVDQTAAFDEDARLIDWGPEGIDFSAEQKTTSQVYRLQPGGAITRLTGNDTYRAGEASFSHDGTRWAFIASDPAHVAEVEVSAAANFAPKRLTDFGAQLRGYTLGRAEVISWRSHDGATIEGILHKPANFVEGKKYPLLVIIHGGPTGVSTAALNAGDSYYPVERWLARGALVLEPNYRGSSGYGGAFRRLNVRNLGVGDMWDVMSGVEALIARGLVDPAHMGAMGWSEGGYISAFLTTHTARFRAISVGAGISDWMTYYVSTDITPFTRQYLLATPWKDPGLYAKTSPITTITQARTPTLIQQGSLDQRVPVPDSFELYRGLRDMHVPTRLILYTGYGHPITKPKSNLAVLQSNWDWFGHYLWGDPIPADSPLYGTSELKP